MRPTIKRTFGYGGVNLHLMTDGTLRYQYWLDEVVGGDTCMFSLWSEVGQPYRNRFKTIFSEYGTLAASSARALPTCRRKLLLNS